MGYSDVEMVPPFVWLGTGNINVDPKFRSPTAGNLRLISTSPCLDSADYSKLPFDDLDVDGNGITYEILPIDLDVGNRLVDLSVTDTGVGSTTGPFACPLCTYLDMGAYERP